MNRPIRDGFSLVWRHQRLVWWIFFVNLALGFLASIAPRIALRHALDSSLHAKPLTEQFDATTFIELLSKPEVTLSPSLAGSAVVGILFLIYTLFISGGVVSVYTNDRKLTHGEFFQSCGAFFWRMFRLLLCSIVPFGIVFAVLSKVQSASGKMASDAPWEMQGFWLQISGTLLCLLLALFVRAWLDLAQAHTVREQLRGMFFLSCRSFVLALRNLPRLLSIYFGITLLGALLAAGTWFFWLNIPHKSFGASWLLLELLTLLMVGLRLWQRAATVLWYENYAELHPAFLPQPPTPLPQPIAEVETVPVVPPSLEEDGQPVT